MRLKGHEVCPLVLNSNGNPVETQNNLLAVRQSWSDQDTQQWANSNKYCSNNICDNIPSSENLNANNQTYSYENSTTNVANRETNHILRGTLNDTIDNARINANEEVYRFNGYNDTLLYSRTDIVLGSNSQGCDFYATRTIYEGSTLEDQRNHGAAPSVCSETSPVDSLLDYDTQQNSSSTDASPQDEEDHPFDQSDSDELSDENVRPIPRGIINPNYPGFQHLAHTLEDYPENIHNTSTLEGGFAVDELNLQENSEPNIIIGDFDDNFYERFMEHQLSMQQNNNNEIEDYPYDHHNRLERIENNLIIKHDKSTFNLVTSDKENNINIGNACSEDSKLSIMCNYIESEELTNGSHNENKDLQSIITDKIISDEGNYIRSISTADIIGDFGKEIEQEIGEIVRRNSNFQDDLFALQQDIHDVIQKPLEDTINNISDVVNRVIEKIVIDQAVGGYQQWLQPFNKVIDTKNSNIQDFKPDSANYDIDTTATQSCQSSCVDNTNQNEIALSNKFKNEIIINENVDFSFDDISSKMADAFLSNAKDVINAHSVNIRDKEINFEEDAMMVGNIQSIKDTQKSEFDLDLSKGNKVHKATSLNKEYSLNVLSDCLATEMKTEPRVQVVKPMITNKEVINTLRSEKDIDSVVLRKKEKSDARSRCAKKLRRESSTSTAGSGGVRPRDNLNRRSLPVPPKKTYGESGGLFDVYNIETAMPNIDLDAIENHLKAARDEERRRRNDREEIRRRLAMGTEQDDYYTPSERPGRKPSLQSRLQSGMNLQICFMNETASDTESPGSDTETKSYVKSPHFSALTERLNDDIHPAFNYNHPYQTKPLSVSINQPTTDFFKPKTAGRVRPSSLSLSSLPTRSSLSTAPLSEADFFARQARLQAEARMALAQAKEMARVQMEIERQKQQISPITEMLRASLQKAGIPLSPDRRRVSRQLLTDMNVAQLQIIVNELHTQIENLNEQLVRLLMARDDLHMGQDSMLVDIEDLTRYLGAKEQSGKPASVNPSTNASSIASLPTVASAVHHNSTFSSPISSLLSAPGSGLRPKLHRIASLVKK